MIVSVPIHRDRSIRFRFRIDRLLHEGKEVESPGQVRLSWYGSFTELKAGDQWRVSIRLKRPSGFMNPGGFDYEGWLFQQQIAATGYVRKNLETNRLLESGTFSLNHQPIHYLRQSIAEKINKLSEGLENTGIITALIIGERSQISTEQWDVLTKTGTNHLLAISGLHIGLISGLFFFLMRKVWSLSSRLTLYWPAPKAAAVAALLGAIIYAALAGFSIPTQRALVMVAVIMGSILLDRTSLPGRSIALALLLVLLLDPLSVLSVGFWLSFAAVSVILYGMTGRINNKSSMPVMAWHQWGKIQWLILVGLLPLTLLFFQRVSVFAPVANLVAVPWVSFLVVPIVFLAVLLMGVQAKLAGWLLTLVDHLLNGLWWFLDELASLPFALWVQPSPPVWIVVLGLLGAIVMLAPKGFPARWLGAVLLLPVFLNMQKKPETGEVWFTLLDVGQGLAAVVQTREHTLVFDTGPRFSSSFDTGDAVVVPFLSQMGIHKIDRLLISHGDNDHIGGAQSILRQIPVDEIYTGVPEKFSKSEFEDTSGINAKQCTSNQSWNWDGVEFKILHPPETLHSFTKNDGSCVLHVQARGGSMLLTGDIHKKSEQHLVKYYPAEIKASILVAPHHGSKTSSSPEFIQTVNPQYVLFPAGYRNRFNHPAENVVDRYKENGIQLLDSAAHGAIQFRIGRTNESGGRVSAPETYRQIARHYWNR